MSRTWKKEIKIRKEKKSDKKKKKRAKKTFQKVLFFLWVAWEVYIFKKKNLQKNKKISSLKKKKLNKWKRRRNIKVEQG